MGKEVDKEEMHKVASPLSSPEVKKRATDNQVCAKIKLRSKELSGALHSNIGPSWFHSLQGEFKKPYFVELSSYLEKERAKEIIYPPGEQVWTWTRDFEVKDTKVVILGQDPYHGPGQAHGLCFSVQKGTKIPPSLVNMYKELKEDEIVDFVHPGHGFLQGWADQGVLLLNACLTVQKGHANSHKDRGWEKITDKVIKAVSDECPPGVVFLLWGSFAQKGRGGRLEKTPLAQDRPSVSPVGTQRLHRFQTLLQMQRATEKVEQGADRLGQTTVICQNATKLINLISTLFLLLLTNP